MKEKKKPNIVLYTIIMFAIFTIITEIAIYNFGAGFVLYSIFNHPQGNLVISEAVLAVLILIVMLLFKNSYVFTQKKEKITKGLYYGIFMIIVSIIMMIMIGVINGGFKNVMGVINILMGCFFVGIAEEFLCRGWLLNEFLERFGDTKKGVWYSIIVSGIIFGLIHLTNIIALGQSVPMTIQQVINAATLGIMFGIIYYKTKNIWSVIVLHGLWDFSLYLSTIAPVNSTIELITNYTIIGFTFAIITTFITLLNIIPHMENIDGEPKKKAVIGIGIISAILYFLFLLISTSITTQMGETYEFDSINFDYYSLTQDNYDEYYIKNNDYAFKLSKNDNNKLVFTNMNTNYAIELDSEILNDYTIIRKNDCYILAYVDYRNHSNPFLKYIFIRDVDLSNDNAFVDSINTNMKKYLISDFASELLIITDQENNTSYLSAYSQDYGYYILVSEDKMAILNRDKQTNK